MKHALHWTLLIAVFALLVVALAVWLAPASSFLERHGDLLRNTAAAIAILTFAMSAAGWLWRRLRPLPASDRPPAARTSADAGPVGKKATAEGGGVIVEGGLTQSTIFTGDVTIQQAAASGSKNAHGAPLEAVRAKYLEHLADRYRYLDFKGIGPSDKAPFRMELLDLYVPLEARIDMPDADTWDRRAHLAGRALTEEDAEAMKIGARASEPRPVLELMREHDGLVILGDPGSGKTTFLKSLAVNLALGSGEALELGDRLPVLVPLSAYANALAKGDPRLDDFIAGYIHDLGGDAAMRELLRHHLEAGSALLLLDGLDEVRALGQRQTVVSRVVDFFTFHRRAGNKFVVTSRVVGYKEVRTAAEGLAECTLVDFSDDEIGAFVERWTRAVEAQARGKTAVEAAAEQERQELMAAIERNAGVRRLAANPLLLTILALMKRHGVTLPERRVELYEEYVNTLIATWNRARGLGRPPERDLDARETVRILGPLALWMHEEDPGLGLVGRAALERRLTAIYEERGEERPDASAQTFLRDVREHSGLLLERGAGRYGFIHLTFEEYLAAVGVALAAQGSVQTLFDALVARLGEPAWREVALLLIGYVGLVQQLDSVAGEVLDRLIDEAPGEPGEATLLAGEALLDAGTGGLPPRCRKRVIEALVPTLQGRNIAPERRRRAGLLLGELGWRPADLDHFVEIPAGEFLYGDAKEGRRLPHRFFIGKYPVTNEQFARFIADGGYRRRELWSDEGWAWREKHERVGPWRFSDEFSNPIFPRVGVSWYESDAYARWLGINLDSLQLSDQDRIPVPEGYLCRLPSEEEWERAARGDDGREFPWGDEFAVWRANTNESKPPEDEDEKERGIGGGMGTTAVCTYPGGVSPYGVWDLSGNIGEWTSSLQENNIYLLTGSDFYSNIKWARCASRDGSVPRLDSGILGFRVVFSLAVPES